MKRNRLEDEVRIGLQKAMSPQRFQNSQVDHRVSWNYFLPLFLRHQEADKLDVGIVGSHGKASKNDRDSKHVAVVPEAEFGKFERSYYKLDALLFG
jgi:hypothetical protein